MKKVIAAVLLLCVMAVHAGPFGLSQGMTLAELSKHGVLKRWAGHPGWYETNSLRNGHNEFIKYRLMVDEETGLCAVTAIGKHIATDSMGEALRSEFNVLVGGLEQKYGKSSRLDRLKEESTLQGKDEFMVGLARKERIFSAYWMSPVGVLPGNLTHIWLGANAMSASKGWLSLEYGFSTELSCADRIKAKVHRNL